MADKSIGELVAASAVNPSDLFVLQQNNTAKKLTGQILENWLLTLADGHGGIQTITKTGTAGFVDTYTITYADTTTSTFQVTNGRSITNIYVYYARSTSGTTVPTSGWTTTRQSLTSTYRYLWSYQRVEFNGGSPNYYESTKTVIGVWGDKGDKGDTGTSVVAIVAQSVPVGAAYKDYKFEYSDGTYTNVIRIYDGRGISSIEKTATSADGLTDTYTITYTYGTPATSTFTVTNAKSIVSITKTGTVGLQDTYTIAYNDNTTSTFVVTNGKSITGISKTGTSGLVDTYSITWNDGSNPTTFTVTNGSSISSIAKTGTVGLVDTYTVTMTDGTTSTFTVTNAKSITSVTQVSGTHAAGTTDVYRITFNDGDTTDFSVYNGANGSGAVSTVDGIQPGGNQNVTLLLTGNGAPTTSTVGQLYQRYFDLNSQILYICTGVDTSVTPNTYSWAGTGVPVDSSLSSSSVNPVQNKVITGKVGTSSLNTTAQNISDAVNELDSDLNTKADKTALATYVRPNLLDNWYFAKGAGTTGSYGVFPVNQRRQGSYTGSGYCIDRWYVATDAITVNVTVDTSVVKLSGSNAGSSNYQIFKQLISEKYIANTPITMSLLVKSCTGSYDFFVGSSSTNANRLWSSTYSTPDVWTVTGTIASDVTDFTCCLRSRANSGNYSIEIAAIKVEIGDTQTLARKVGNDWVLNEIPNYTDELRKCQAYFIRIVPLALVQYAILSTAQATSATRARAFIPLPATLKSAPTVSSNGAFELTPDLSEVIAVTGISYYMATNCAIGLNVDVASGLTAGNPYFFRTSSGYTQYIDVSAES